jgi:hypothetical protein
MHPMHALGRASHKTLAVGLLLLGCVGAGSAFAQIPAPDQGKLIETGGVSEIEGAGGGGLTPWALITGYGTDQSYGANAHITEIRTSDYLLTSQGIAIGLFDRLEASFANERFSATDGGLKGVAVREQISGLKLSVLGDAVYAQDSVLPQVAVGVQYHDHRGITGLQALGIEHPADLGARKNSGTDYYVSATKILLNESLLLNGTVRYTDANQFGLVGFGGDRNSARQAMFEASLGYLVSRHLVVGLEYRQMPHNLSIDDERDVYDAFIAWLPSHNLSITAAFVSLGTILKPLEPRQQNGLYLSSQVGF